MNMSVDRALILGLMPSLAIEYIVIDRVDTRPVVKKLIINHPATA